MYAQATSFRDIPQAPPISAAEEFKRLTTLCHLLDQAFEVPGTRIRVGLDSLVGLIPGIGDAVTTVAAGYVIHRAARLGVSRWTLMRMLGNVGVDMMIGIVPVLGDLFDVGWKSNMRNLRLIEAHLAKAGHLPRTVDAEVVRRD